MNLEYARLQVGVADANIRMCKTNFLKRTQLANLDEILC